MFWYIVLFVLTIVFALVAFASMAIFILSGCEVPEILLATLLTGAIAIGLGCGASEIEKENTTITTEAVAMEVTKCEIGGDKYYITVDNQYIIRVGMETYATLDKGDIVLVEVTTKITFGEPSTTVALHD